MDGVNRPRCYNRAPHTNPLGGPLWFVDRCATWDGTGIGPNGERYPVAHGFDCRGCKWLPAEHAHFVDTHPPQCVTINRNATEGNAAP